MSTRQTILRNVYRKVDGMSVSFGMPPYTDELTDEIIEKHIGIDLNDTMRELRIQSVDSITDMSELEFHIENRTVYYIIRRLRNSASVYFKFSTATDGKSIDKSMIPKMLSNIMRDYDEEFRMWRRSTASGSLWNR